MLFLTVTIQSTCYAHISELHALYAPGTMEGTPLAALHSFTALHTGLQTYPSSQQCMRICSDFVACVLRHSLDGF